MATPSAVPVLIPSANGAPPDLWHILDINRAAYDMLAGTYQETTRSRQENAKKWLVKRLPGTAATSRPTALDIGCADGTHSRVLSSLGYDVIGIDFSERMISAARRLAADPTLPNKPHFLHGEFLAGQYVDAAGRNVPLDGTQFDLVLATAFVHLFPEEYDEDAVHKVLAHVAPRGSALISTTASESPWRGLETKTGANGLTTQRWRNRYTLEHFVWLVRRAARDIYGARVSVRPWVVGDPDSDEKQWVDISVTRLA